MFSSASKVSKVGKNIVDQQLRLYQGDKLPIFVMQLIVSLRQSKLERFDTLYFSKTWYRPILAYCLHKAKHLAVNKNLLKPICWVFARNH